MDGFSHAKPQLIASSAALVTHGGGARRLSRFILVAALAVVPSSASDAVTIQSLLPFAGASAVRIEVKLKDAEGSGKLAVHARIASSADGGRCGRASSMPQTQTASARSWVTPEGCIEAARISFTSTEMPAAGSRVIPPGQTVVIRSPLPPGATDVSVRYTRDRRLVLRHTAFE